MPDVEIVAYRNFQDRQAGIICDRRKVSSPEELEAAMTDLRSQKRWLELSADGSLLVPTDPDENPYQMARRYVQEEPSAPPARAPSTTDVPSKASVEKKASARVKKSPVVYEARTPNGHKPERATALEHRQRFTTATQIYHTYIENLDKNSLHSFAPSYAKSIFEALLGIQPAPDGTTPQRLEEPSDDANWSTSAAMEVVYWLEDTEAGHHYQLPSDTLALALSHLETHIPLGHYDNMSKLRTAFPILTQAFQKFLQHRYSDTNLTVEALIARGDSLQHE